MNSENRQSKEKVRLRGHTICHPFSMANQTTRGSTPRTVTVAENRLSLPYQRFFVRFMVTRPEVSLKEGYALTQGCLYWVEIHFAIRNSLCRSEKLASRHFLHPKVREILFGLSRCPIIDGSGTASPTVHATIPKITTGNIYERSLDRFSQLCPIPLADFACKTGSFKSGFFVVEMDSSLPRKN